MAEKREKTAKKKAKKAAQKPQPDRKLTPTKKAEFLDTLRRTCNVTLAADAIGMARGYMYEYRAKDTPASRDFAKAWDNAVQEGIDRLEAEAHRRAFSGVDEPVYQGGKLIGRVRKYSDTLTIFLLKAHRPERFRENFKHEVVGANDGPIDMRVRVEFVE